MERRVLRAVLESCRTDRRINELMRMHQKGGVTGGPNACATTTGRLSDDTFDNACFNTACDDVVTSRREAHGGGGGAGVVGCADINDVEGVLSPALKRRKLSGDLLSALSNGRKRLGEPNSVGCNTSEEVFSS